MSDWDWTTIPQHIIDRVDFAGRQAELFEQLRQGKNGAQAAKAIGMDTRNGYTAIRRTMERIKKEMAKVGYSPTFDASRFVDHGQRITGKSTFTKDDEGNPVWIKTAEEKEKSAIIKYAESLSETIIPAKPVKLSKASKDPDLMSAIFIGDAHIGQYSYGRETGGQDFDSDIAAAEIRAAIDDLVDRSPKCETGLLVEVGDFMHADTAHSKTYAGTDVDVDTRFERVLEIAGKVMQYSIDRMLRKFDRVVVVIAKGNHNPTAAVAVNQITKAYYRNEPRVKVLDTIGFFHYLEWGKWLIGVNHGDKIKAEKLPGIMARDMAQAWGRTTGRMWALGHLHHRQVLELEGCTVQRFGALPPPDSWHAGQGYGSGRVMEMVVFRKDGGRHSSMIYEIPRLEREVDIKI